MSVFNFLIIICTLLSLCHGARILGLFPLMGRSHMIVNSALVQELARRGHQVTVLSYFPQKPPFPNITDIPIGTLEYENFKPNLNFFNLAGAPAFVSAIVLWFRMPVNADEALKQPEVQKFIESTDQEFDLIIMEAFFNEAFLGFAHKFKAPVVQICAFGGIHWMGDWFGNPNPYSYVPDFFLNYSDKMNLWQRIVNTLVGTFFRVGRQLFYIPRQEAVMRKHFEGLGPLPSLAALEMNTSLLIVNNHFSLNYPKPLMPSIVQAGGLHVKPPKKLPQELQKYLDEAKDGVIYFSMGSNLQSSDMPEEKRNAFLKAFSKLRQKVLWKWEVDSLPGQPSNVKLGKWLPQSDILAHPNVRLFITHGGLMSFQEAVHRGVPLLAVPVMGDQRLNAQRAESSGFSVTLEYNAITEEMVSRAIEAALNPRNRENVQHLSRIFRDQPLTPLETAVYWTEYVIRHKGAPHLRSAAVKLSWYQYLLLDVIAVLTLSVTLVTFVIFFTIRKLSRWCCKKQNNDKSIKVSDYTKKNK